MKIITNQDEILFAILKELKELNKKFEAPKVEEVKEEKPKAEVKEEQPKKKVVKKSNKK